MRLYALYFGFAFNSRQKTATQIVIQVYIKQFRVMQLHKPNGISRDDGKRPGKSFALFVEKG